MAPSYRRWETRLHELVRRNGYTPSKCYCLKDQVKAKYNQPYFPEKESDEQSARNAIRLRVATGALPVEISTTLPRLKPVTEKPVDRIQYYVPADLREKVLKLKADWDKK